MTQAFELPPLPGHMQLRPESPVALSSESIAAMLESYGRLCVDADLEAAARECEQIGARHDFGGYSDQCSAAIRSLKAG
jgi:hypothetical protein